LRDQRFISNLRSFLSLNPDVKGLNEGALLRKLDLLGPYERHEKALNIMPKKECSPPVKSSDKDDERSPLWMPP
jgi:hypothetical protein